MSLRLWLAAVVGLVSWSAPAAAQSPAAADAVLRQADTLDAQAKSKATTPAESAKLRPQAFDAYVRACDQGNRRACGEAADPMRLMLAYPYADEGQRDALTKRYAEKLRLLDRAACLAGSVDECLDYNRQHGKTDPVAKPILEAACAKDNRMACYQLGRVTTADRSQIDSGLAKAEPLCSGGDAAACYELARFYLGVTPGMADPAKGRAYLERACTLGKTEGCEGLAMALLRGTGGAKDPARAFQLLDGPCKAGRLGTCDLQTAAAVAPDSGVDPRTVLALLDGRCTAGKASGCQAVIEYKIAGEKPEDHTVRQLTYARRYNQAMQAECAQNSYSAECKRRDGYVQAISDLKERCAGASGQSLCRRLTAARVFE